MTPAERAAPFRRPPGRRPFVLGHRGARAHAPENTLVAFNEALRQGADGIELDVRMTADAELVISHDDRVLIRDAAHPEVSLSHLSRAQIRAARLLSGEPVPFLDEVLSWQERSRAIVNVELKGDVPEPLWMAERVVRMVRAHGGKGLCFSSFHLLQVRYLARSLPEAAVGLLYHDEQTLVKRLVPYRALGAVAVHPQRTLVTRETVVAFHEQGALVNVWTVNDAEEARRFADFGVDALITDSPQKILAAL